jgi:pyruvate/2-oxoglutarate dehydrogenase complex dihydrolipoamide acyltransferase (E2) component
MSIDVVLPKTGMGIEEGTIVKWLKSEGDRVQKDEPIVEVETAKALQEVVAPVGGILSKIVVPEGNMVEVHTTIAMIDPDDD